MITVKVLGSTKNQMDHYLWDINCFMWLYVSRNILCALLALACNIGSAEVNNGSL